jgi:hypothetical protein
MLAIVAFLAWLMFGVAAILLLIALLRALYVFWCTPGDWPLALWAAFSDTAWLWLLALLAGLLALLLWLLSRRRYRFDRLEASWERFRYGWCPYCVANTTVREDVPEDWGWDSVEAVMDFMAQPLSRLDRDRVRLMMQLHHPEWHRRAEEPLDQLHAGHIEHLAWPRRRPTLWIPQAPGDAGEHGGHH